MTVPKQGGEHDLPSLTACARRIKGARPEPATETQVTLTASPEVPYASVIAIMDALRSDEAGELFPEVHSGVARERGRRSSSVDVATAIARGARE